MTTGKIAVGSSQDPVVEEVAAEEVAAGAEGVVGEEVVEEVQGRVAGGALPWAQGEAGVTEADPPEEVAVASAEKARSTQCCPACLLPVFLWSWMDSR